MTIPHPQVLFLTGGSGFIGSAIAKSFQQAGWKVVILSRRAKRWQARSPDYLWLSEVQQLSEQPDLMINLAGAPLMTRWTTAAKERFFTSRVGFTRELSEYFANNPSLAPRKLFSGSAVGFYLPGDLATNESGQSGHGVSAALCREWEEAAAGFKAAGTQVCVMRTGVVLDPHGGALAAMLPLFRLGLGGVLGDGNQWFSWISRVDLVSAVAFLAKLDDLPPVVNLVAPTAVTNKLYTRALGSALNRPTPLPTPAWVWRLALREGADEFLLANLHIVPSVLMGLGFPFKHPDIHAAFLDFFGSR